MDYAVLDIHGLGLNLWHAKDLLHSSPAYALIEGDKLLFGQQAKAQARIQPQNIHNKFWHRLDTRALDNPFGQMRHCADIAHEHLLHLSRETEISGDVVIAVPAHYSQEQLSLLLGIVEQSPFRVIGLVDGSLARALPQLESTRTSYLDIQLYDISIAHLELIDDLWQSKQTIKLPDCGWLVLQEKLYQSIADTFVTQTRFDPRGNSSAEQALYDELPRYLQLLQDREVINIESGEHTARIESSTLAKSCQNIYKTIYQAVPNHQTPACYSPLIKLLPGFQKMFPQLPLVCESNLPEAVFANESLIVKPDQNIAMIRSLPSSAKPDIIAIKEIEPPTHILDEYTAYPLLNGINWFSARHPNPQAANESGAESAIALEYKAGQLLLLEIKNCSPRVNGNIVRNRTILQHGDQIEWQGKKISLITVRNGNGS